MRKTIIILSLIMFTFHSFAQEKTRVREAGISFKNLDEFGLLYRIGNNKSVWRFAIRGNRTTPSRSERHSTSDNGNNISKHVDTGERYGFGIWLGKEFRKKITDNIGFRYGLGAGISKTYYEGKSKMEDLYLKPQKLTVSERNSKMNSNDIRVNLILGFNYLLNDIVIGVEINPSMKYSYKMVNTNSYMSSVSENGRVTNQIRDFSDDGSSPIYTWNLSTNSAVLSVAYRF